MPSPEEATAPDPPLSHRLPRPDYLSKEAAKVWDQVVRRVVNAEEQDEVALVAYCEQFAIWLDALKEVKKGGLVIATKRTGFSRPNPHVLVLNSAHDRLVKMLQEFKMTPASRSSLRSPMQRGALGGSQPKTGNRFAAIQRSSTGGTAESEE